MVSGSIAQLVEDANRRLAARGKGSLHLESSGRHVVLHGPESRDESTLVAAGAAVFGLRAAAEGIGLRVEVDAAPGGVPTLWATLTVHPRSSRSAAVDVVWSAGPGAGLGSERAAHRLSARQLVAVCERGAAGEGVSVRVAPMPLPSYFGLVLRAGGDEQMAWFSLGQAWAGIERLAERCGWTAHLRMRSTSAPPADIRPWFSAQVEVWVLRRPNGAPATSGPATTQLRSDEWMGF